MKSIFYLLNFIFTTCSSDLHRDFYITACTFVNTLFEDTAVFTYDQINEKRENVLKSEPKKIKFYGYTYLYSTQFIKYKISDYINKASYKYNVFESLTYPNRLNSFLNCHLYDLSLATPNTFIKAFVLFFNLFINNFISCRMKMYTDHSELMKKLKETLSITDEFEDDFEWNDLTVEIQRVFKKKIETFELNFRVN